ncbi:MAG TPA: MBL fold metallo-hydrolase [Pseudomonadales bacterium]|nr:MBL fold metallo-hydrolase [Pseudomonadales bacterium]
MSRWKQTKDFFLPAGWKGEKTDHFDGRFFRNQPRAWGADGKPIREHRSPSMMRQWLLTRQPSRWPKWVEIPGQTKPAARIDNGPELHATFINHATILLQTAGLNILTDPVWSERCSPFAFAGPKRVHLPGVAFTDLPKIDIVLLSHNHYDHLDLPTLQKLWQRDQPLILTGLGVGDFLQSQGVGAVQMDWWQSHTVQDHVIHFVPAQHFSGRSVSDFHATLWGGFVLETKAGPVYFAGDTGEGPHFTQINQKFGPMRFSLLPIGAYMPRWFMSLVHIGPEEAVAAHKTLNSALSLAIHWGTFHLADEGREQPLSDLEHALVKQNVNSQAFIYLHPGESVSVPPLSG